MKILFYGYKGWIGNQFYNYLTNQKKYVIVAGKSRIDNDSELEEEIKRETPTHVVSFTGRTHGTYNGKKINTIDYLENKGVLTENIQDNMYGPVLLAILSLKYKFHYTYLGTGCIFNYDNEHPFEKEENGFEDNDSPNYFGSSYSIVKGFTDRLFHNLPVLNLRIRMPITSDVNERNFITKITRYEKICSIKNSMTVLSDFYPIIEDLMKKFISKTINLTNPGLISHNEILQMYKEIVDNNFTWKNFTIDEQSSVLKAARSNNYLDTRYIEENYNVPNIKASVYRIMQEYKNKI
jgi:3,5-epimerase/4-reductase